MRDTFVHEDNPKSVMSTGVVEDENSKVLERMLCQLSDVEKNTAARSSYHYLVTSTLSSSDPLNEVRDMQAKVMIGRYLAVEQKLKGSKTINEKEATALAKLKETLEYRVQMNVDELRMCFNSYTDVLVSNHNRCSNVDEKVGAAEDNYKTGDDCILSGDTCKNDIREYYRKIISSQLAKKASVVFGYTKDKRAIFSIFPRFQFEWDKEYFLLENIYMLERAMACTERRTNGATSKVAVIFDYSGYTFKNTPPIPVAKELLFVLRDHYPGCIQNVYVVDAPFIFQAFWAVVKYFIDPITKELVKFVSGDKAKEEVFGKIVDVKEAMPWILPGGEKSEHEQINMQAFLTETAFDRAYDDEE